MREVASVCRETDGRVSFFDVFLVSFVSIDAWDDHRRTVIFMRRVGHNGRRTDWIAYESLNWTFSTRKRGWNRHEFVQMFNKNVCMELSRDLVSQIFDDLLR